MVMRLPSAVVALAVVSAALGSVLPASPSRSSEPDQLLVTYKETIRPILNSYCFDCHGPEKQKGSVQLDTLDPDFTGGHDAEEWHFALDMIQGAEMPPSKAKQMSDAERRALVNWIEDSLEAAKRASAGPTRPVLRRLNQAQYTHTLQDLLHLDIRFGDRLPGDAKSKLGFTNNGEVLLASPLHIDNYQAIARAALDEAVALGERPDSVRYRVRIGKGIGRGKVGARTGGYQSVPVDSDDFAIDLLDAEGRPRVPASDAEEKRMNAIRKKISIGLRGSAQDRFRITNEGMVLYGAVPHREVAPGAWQGPSPNVKLEMQRVFPEQGDLAMRVSAARGQMWDSAKVVLLAMEDRDPMVSLAADTNEIIPRDGTMVSRALSTDQRKNLRNEGSSLVPVDVTLDSKARFGIKVPREGFYQIDLAHRPVTADAMPSIRLGLRKLTLDLRPVMTGEQLKQRTVLTTIGAAYLLKGSTHMTLGGPFFTGFSEVALTPIETDHALVMALLDKTEEQEALVADRLPALRVYAGTRTDDGMDYHTFDRPQEVSGAVGEFETYEFFGRLENLPIPEPESGDLEILSGFLLLGLWNDHLVKDRKEPGPPLLIESIEVEAPYYPVWPPRSHTDIFVERADRESDAGYAGRVIASFAERAFRRPPEPDVVSRYVDFWESIQADYPTLEESVKEVLIALLCSPRFLFLAEPEVTGDVIADGSPAGVPGARGLIDEWSLASRLSYFLWNSCPDEELTRLAGAGTLRANLDGQIQRMLDDPRRRRFIDAFTEEWLRLDRLEQMTVDARRYPAFTRFVKRDMREETLAFLDRVVAEDLPLTQLVDSDFAMLNQNLAEFYGISGVMGPHFRAVELPPNSGRGGLLSHGAFLVGHSDGVQPHPIKRAVWLKDRILGDPAPPPPPNVPDLDPDTPGFDKLTLKEQLELHRDSASCRDCHAGIDPYGVAFERYNAVGLFEPQRKGRPVDASTTLPDGTGIDGLAALKSYLLDTATDDIAMSVIEHLYAYALGRDVSFTDEDDLEAILEQTRASGGSMRSVIEGIVHSPAFHR
ncbi:MAG: mono/diheme cytochrome c family protein [Planctomycetota bacterium]|jgi:mono/diheme cytochrome c family protein